MELPKKYDPQVEEPKLQKFWEDENIYKFDPDSDKPLFTIDTPPPTVSGKMHIGHAFGNSQQDFIARYKRMKGFNVLQPFGTDDNGLPTKLLIEKLKKVRATDMHRKEFTKLCLDTLNNELKPSYTNDWKRLGVSCDFSVKYSTIDPHCRKISQKSFIDLYKKGREYRVEAPAIYCPKCKTAIAQVECEDKEVASHFNNIVFKVGDKDLIIATTRPELLPACVGVFYHPDDKRYKNLKGMKAKVPLFDFEVPILEDERADPEKGTGIVMCCTFGDQTDMEWQKIHKLSIKKAIGNNGLMTDIADKYKGMKIDNARKEIIKDLKEKGLLKDQKPITHIVNVHERCGTTVEFVHSKQWFIKYLDLKDKMLAWGNELEWHPKFMKNRYDNWVNGLAWDWCISRQLPFGIPFPVWYCKDCDEIIFAKEEDLPVDPTEDKAPIEKCPKCDCSEFIGEKDIINTWATSSLTPTIVIELFKDKPIYEKLRNNPMDLRPQGHDIITFWLFNTVVKSKLHFNMKPWNHCFINGWMLDPKGKKMAKSKGNVIEPRDIIKKYSADALRFMAGGNKLGEDLGFSEKDVVTGKKTVTKIWNASKFVFMHLEDYDLSKQELLTFDKWFLSKLNKLIKFSTGRFEMYRFSRPKLETDKLFWHTFCDNYLEVVKDRLYNPDVRGNDERKSAQYTLYNGLLSILKLYSPFIPFITEEVYQLFFKDKEKIKSIHVSKWPEVDESMIDEDAELAGDLAIEVIGIVRKFKSDNKVSLKTPLQKLVIKCEKPEHKVALMKVIEDIKAVTHAEAIVFDQEVSIKCENYPMILGIELGEVEKK
tara:strand:+ start:5019 stop:7478 length:2460 start_codon:yes stop_codon:yes gene_type:complete